MGSGCGAVGGAVASVTRYPRFESDNRHFMYYLSTVLNKLSRKEENKEKRCQELTQFFVTLPKAIEMTFPFVADELSVYDVNLNTSNLLLVIRLDSLRLHLT